MEKPHRAIRFAQTRGERYSIALFDTHYIIEYTHGIKTGMEYFEDSASSLRKRIHGPLKSCHFFPLSY